MADAPAAKLADLIVNYSVEVQPGQLVRLDGGTVAAPLLLEIYRQAIRAGAHPYTRIALEGTEHIVLSEGSDDQIAFVSEIERHEVEELDSLITIWAERNTRPLTQADPVRVSRRITAQRALSTRYS